MDGICTLANDRVYDQLIALLNSIEANAGKQIPVCIYPYDDNTEKIAAAIKHRPQVQLYNNSESIHKWDEFARRVWDTHPTAKQRWQKIGSNGYHRFGTHRRYGAFDGPFDRFLYMDADTLLISPPDAIFAQLDSSDWVVYDFQYKDPTHVYEVSSPKLREIFPPERIEREIFCSGLYASKRDIFDEAQREWLISRLKDGEAEILYPMAPDQTILNYMVMRSGLSFANLARQLPPDSRTGNSVTSSHFTTDGGMVLDKGNPLTYLHYIGISSSIFADLCQGENLDFPYRDVFLHYRYLSEPENRPQFTTKPKPYNPPPTFTQRVLRKLGLG